MLTGEAYGYDVWSLIPGYSAEFLQMFTVNPDFDECGNIRGWAAVHEYITLHICIYLYLRNKLMGKAVFVKSFQNVAEGPMEMIV